MGIKQIVKKCLTSGQWDALSRGKRKVLGGGTALVTHLARLLPVTNQLELRSRLQRTGRMDYEPVEILLYVDSPTEYQTRLHSCAKEPEMVQWIEKSFGKGEVFYDIGANVGAYSLLAAKLYGSDIAVYAFEPAFPNFVQLCRNISLNRCQDSLVPLQIGLSDTTSLVGFNYSDLGTGSALHALGEPMHVGEAFIPSIQLPVISYRLDDLLEQFDLPVPNHIKIDVDGIEWEILQGAATMLQNPQVKDLMIEVDEGMDVTPLIVNYLGEKGFALKDKYKFVLSSETGKYAHTYNYLFERKVN